MQPTRLLLLSTAALAAASTGALAQVSTSLTADSSAEILLDGVRTFNGDVSQAFFNIQGDDDTFARFAVVDFASPDFGADVTDLSDVTLSLTQDNAGFSTSGNFVVFIASDTSAITVDSAAGVHFQRRHDRPELRPAGDRRPVRHPVRRRRHEL